VINMDEIFMHTYRLSIDELERLRNTVDAELMFRTREGVDD